MFLACLSSLDGQAANTGKREKSHPSSRVCKGVYTLARGPANPWKSQPIGPYHFIIGPVVCHREDSLAPTSDVVQIKQHCHVAVRQGGLLSGSPTVDIPTWGHVATRPGRPHRPTLPVWLRSQVCLSKFCDPDLDLAGKGQAFGSRKNRQSLLHWEGLSHYSHMTP